MSIAQQVATPTPSRPARRPSRPLRPAPRRRPVRALLRICGLVAVTAVAVALTIGTVAVGLALIASNLAS
jgi:ferric-dicitrate binding protein FerR (iron transport regulator)